MRLSYLLVPTALCAALSLNCQNDDVLGPAEQSFEWTGQIAAGDRIEIKGVNGRVRATGTTAGAVSVSATKRSQRSDPAGVAIEVVPHADGVTICAVYPDVPGQARNQCLPGDEGSMNVRNNDVNVTFDVSLPAGVVFVGRTVNGTVSAIDVDSDAYLTTVNGDVQVSTSGLAEGSTVNGSITSTIGLSDWGEDLIFATVNGAAKVTIPGSTNAEVRLSTVNGSIDTDFALTEMSPRDVRGMLGSGGPMLIVSTVNGDVELWRGS